MAVEIEIHPLPLIPEPKRCAFFKNTPTPYMVWFAMNASADKNPYLYNRKGHTPFDDMDSLDMLELELIRDEQAERNRHKKEGQE